MAEPPGERREQQCPVGHGRLPCPRCVAHTPQVTVLLDGVPVPGCLGEQLVVGHETEGTPVSSLSDPELIHCADQLGARVRERCARDGVDDRSVAWGARQQLQLALAMFCDVAPGALPDVEDTAAVAMAAWWALVVGTGLGDRDLVAFARTIWEE